MARLNWDELGSHLYHAGVDHGVLYVEGKPAVPWVGLISVQENSSGGEARPLYMDGVKYSNTSSQEEFEGALTAFTYPDEFADCDGSRQVFPGMFLKHQRRKPFGLTFRTKIGNEISGLDFGYQIHILWNLLANPSQQENQTQSEDTEPVNFSWNLTARPQVTPGYRPSAHVVIDSRFTHPSALQDVENFLYGTDMIVPSLPSFTDLVTIFDTYGELVVVDNGDGSFDLIGPSTMLTMLDEDTFQVNADGVSIIDDDTYSVTS